MHLFYYDDVNYIPMKREFSILFAILILSNLVIPYASAEDDEDDGEDDDRLGFGIQEREREHQDEDSSPFSGAILYVTIGAIIVAIGYTAFKIARSKRATKKLQ